MLLSGTGHPIGPIVTHRDGPSRRRSGAFLDDRARDVDGAAHQRFRRLERAIGRMGGERDVLHPSQRMVRRKRLGVKNVEAGVADMAAAQRVEQWCFVDWWY